MVESSAMPHYFFCKLPTQEIQACPDFRRVVVLVKWVCAEWKCIFYLSLSIPVVPLRIHLSMPLIDTIFNGRPTVFRMLNMGPLFSSCSWNVLRFDGISKWKPHKSFRSPRVRGGLLMMVARLVGCCELPTQLSDLPLIININFLYLTQFPFSTMSNIFSLVCPPTERNLFYCEYCYRKWLHT